MEIEDGERRCIWAWKRNMFLKKKEMKNIDEGIYFETKRLCRGK